mmetsp:Transcript_6825/g.17026  ORF Transcript_6825/g.17026 Transcript_6825/m.17026 type:complete len:203 (-) Transcript_6825:2-610(-)
MAGKRHAPRKEVRAQPANVNFDDACERERQREGGQKAEDCLVRFVEPPAREKRLQSENRDERQPKGQDDEVAACDLLLLRQRVRVAYARVVKPAADVLFERRLLVHIRSDCQKDDACNPVADRMLDGERKRMLLLLRIVHQLCGLVIARPSCVMARDTHRRHGKLREFCVGVVGGWLASPYRVRLRHLALRSPDCPRARHGT